MPLRAPLPNICVTGLRTSVREMHTAASTGIILAKFRAAGAAPFFAEVPQRRAVAGKVNALDHE